MTTVSLQATLAGILGGVGAVVYAALADSVSIRRLILVSIILTAIAGFALLRYGVFVYVLRRRGVPMNTPRDTGAEQQPLAS